MKKFSRTVRYALAHSISLSLSPSPAIWLSESVQHKTSFLSITTILLSDHHGVLGLFRFLARLPAAGLTNLLTEHFPILKPQNHNFVWMRKRPSTDFETRNL